MAKTQIKRNGFGQVEPNHLSGIVTGQIYAQLPAQKKRAAAAGVTAKAGIPILEQGQYAKYDYAEGEVNYTGAGEWMLVYNEEHFYDERYTYHKDYAMRADDFIDGTMVPRLIRTYPGDIYTTNTFGACDALRKDVNGIALEVGDKLVIGDNGYLRAMIESGADADVNPEQIWKVVKVYTMPDGQPGVKIQRIS